MANSYAWNRFRIFEPFVKQGLVLFLSFAVYLSCGNLKFNNSNDQDSKAYLETQIWNCLLKGTSCYPYGNLGASSDPSGAINGNAPILNYTVSSHSFGQNIAISPIQPVITGTVTSCVSNPALPSGLTIVNTTCAISGTPTTLQAATNYSITATNAKGSANASIGITIIIPALVQFKFSNGSLADSSTQGISLTTTVGSPASITGSDGEANGAYSFGGSDYFTTVVGGDIGLPMGASSRTMCAWINPSVAPSGNMMVARYGLISPGRASGMGFANANLAFFGNSYDTTFAYSISTNTWSHYCAVFGGGTTVDFYINGTSVGTGTLAGGAGPPLNTGSDGITVGTWGGGFNWIGGIDDVRIYGLALSAISISQMYQGIPVIGP